tara:strand:- start:165 stop:866 length:702 start_codon:yes stop_codon:yes gene_type:complete
LRKIWYEDRLGHLSSFRNLKQNYKEIIPEVLSFVKDNEYLMDQWVMDKWVEDRNLGRVQLWDGNWRVIPFPINEVGCTAINGDYQLSEMVSFAKLFNITLEEMSELGPKITESFMRCCPKTAQYLEEDILKKLLKSATISRLSPGTKINPHRGDIDSLRVHFPVVTDDGAWLSVRGRKRTWEVGDVFGFHDNDKHWAQHNGAHDRVVVIFDYSVGQLESLTEFRLETPEEVYI